jgi:hypothetical protein
MNNDLKDILQGIFGELTDTQIMGLTIYGEARGESRDGKIAVGSVILERVDKHDWEGKTIHEVCLMPYQFSCFLPTDPNFNALALIAGDWNTKAMRSMVMSECYNIAVGLIGGNIYRTKEIEDSHCCNYKTINCKAAWADKMKLIVTIGNHQFYA